MPDPGVFPHQPFHHLDALWIQVAGTLCNLSCAHCFVSSGPGVENHRMMPRAAVRERVAEGLALGVREIYLTGGEPFLHSEILEIVADVLEVAPCTVLTNGTLFTRQRVTALAALSDAARHTLEVRVSLDGETAEAHDRLRGAGAFERAMAGILDLDRAGLLPIVTVTQLAADDGAFRERLLAMLRGRGVARLRLKVLPLFRLGRETGRSGDYDALETLRGLPSEAFDPGRLQCGSSRAVTSEGVFVCPLLVDEPAASMGSSLADTLRPFELSHGACFTCHVTGMTCGNG